MRPSEQAGIENEAGGVNLVTTTALVKLILLRLRREGTFDEMPVDTRVSEFSAEWDFRRDNLRMKIMTTVDGGIWAYYSNEREHGDRRKVTTYVPFFSLHVPDVTLHTLVQIVEWYRDGAIPSLASVQGGDDTHLFFNT